jgi:hypothetical protein
MSPALLVGMILAASPIYDVSLRSEVRGSSDGDADGQLNPALSLTVPLGHLSLLAAYRPRILLFEPRTSKKISLFHVGELRAEQRFSRATRLVIDEQFSYGENSFSFLVTGADVLQPSFDQVIFDRRAQLPPLLYFSEATSISIEQALSRKVGVSATASYTFSGGADAAARAMTPLMRVAGLRLILGSELGTHDSLFTALDGSVTFFSASQRSYVLDAGVGWRHRFSKYSDAYILLGAGAARDESTELIENRLYPYVAVGVRRQLVPGARNVLEGNLNLRVGPATDPIDGRIYLRADTLGTLTYFPILHLGLTAAAGAAIALSGPIQGQTLGFGGVSVVYQLNLHLSLSTGVRLAAQPTGVRGVAQPTGVGGVAQPSVTAVGFFAITVSDRGRF